MATVTAVSSHEVLTDTTSEPIQTDSGTRAAVAAHAVPARQEIKMGRAATAGEGINWLTLSFMVLFHAGALAALFLFSWQRFAVMAVLYVLAINVGI